MGIHQALRVSFVNTSKSRKKIFIGKSAPVLKQRTLRVAFIEDQRRDFEIDVTDKDIRGRKSRCIGDHSELCKGIIEND